MKKLFFPLLPLMLMLLYACQREASLQTVVEQCDGKVAEYVEEFNVADDELYQQLFPNNVAGQFMHENIPLCRWETGSSLKDLCYKAHSYKTIVIKCQYDTLFTFSHIALLHAAYYLCADCTLDYGRPCRS